MLPQSLLATALRRMQAATVVFSAGSSVVAKSASACSYRPPLWPIEAPAVFRFSRTNRMLAWYSIIAIAPSLARSSFLKLASARARASSILVVNVISYQRAR